MYNKGKNILKDFKSRMRYVDHEITGDGRTCVTFITSVSEFLYYSK